MTTNLFPLAKISVFVRIMLLLLALNFIFSQSNAQIFKEDTAFKANRFGEGSFSFADVNRDGYFDLFVNGYENYVTKSKLFLNQHDTSFLAFDSTTFTALNGTTQWADFNNDSLPDLLMIGTCYGNSVLKIYKNNGDTTFSEVWSDNSIYSTYEFNIKDFNHDGMSDILIKDGKYIKYFINKGNFTFTTGQIQEIADIDLYAAEWADFNLDGYLDIVISGSTLLGNLTQVFINDGNNHFYQKITLNNYLSEDIECFDYNADGLPDIAIDGLEAGNNKYHFEIYKNKGDGTFEIVTNSGLQQKFAYAKIKSGDFNNDHLPDLIISGDNLTQVYLNTGNESFVKTNDTITGLNSSRIRLADYDQDGHLDVAIMGFKSKHISKIYRNTDATPPPVLNAPESLSNIVSRGNVRLSWKPYPGNPANVTYNIMLDSVANKGSIITPNSLANGKRYILDNGNAGPDTFFILNNIIPGTYYWKVQALFNGSVTSTFSATDTFTVTEISQATFDNTSNISDSSVTVSWNGPSGANFSVWMKEGEFQALEITDSTTYIADTTMGNGSYSGDWYCIYNGTGLSVNVAGLRCNTVYNIAILSYTGNAGTENYIQDISYNNQRSFETNYLKEINAAPIPGLYIPSASWGDYNNDGFPDLLINGWSTQPITKVYKNNLGTSFAEVTAISLEGTYNGFVKWADLDNDNDLDIIDAGKNYAGEDIVRIYMNEGNDVFTLQSQNNIPGFTSGNIDLADYDNDGDLDMAITGLNMTKIYKNMGQMKFSLQPMIKLPNMSESTVRWIDYNTDGYPDLLLTGKGELEYKTSIFKNNGNNTFSEQANITFPTLIHPKIDIADFNADARPDILLSGIDKLSAQYAFVYLNENSTFVKSENANLPKLGGSVTRGFDFNNDNLADILLSSSNVYFKASHFYQNDFPNGFSYPNKKTFGILVSAIEPADIDLDGTLDYIAFDWSYNYVTKIYKNYNLLPLLLPNAPTGLVAEMDDFITELRWKKSVNSQSFNVRMGKTSQGNEIIPGMSDATGNRSIVSLGNAQFDTSYILKNLSPGTYYWSVQGISNGFKGGPFATEQVFTIDTIQSSALSAKKINDATIQLKWDRGNGNNCIVFCKVGSDGNAVPTDSTTYKGNTTLGEGSAIENSDWYCVYNGKADSTYISGLNPGYTYTFEVSEYFGETGTENYCLKHSVSNRLVSGTGLFAEHQRWVGKGNFMNTIGDFNNDSILDFASATFLPYAWWSANGVAIMKNNKNFSFSENQNMLGFNSGKFLFYDYNHDNILDLMSEGEDAPTPQYLTNHISIYTSNQNDSFFLAKQINLNESYLLASDLADLDNDNDLDLIVTKVGQKNYIVQDTLTYLYKSEADTAFYCIDSTSLPVVKSGNILCADFNNDGLADIVVSGIPKDSVSDTPIFGILLNMGNMSFSKLESFSPEGLYQSNASEIDYNKDGYKDLFICGMDKNLQPHSILYKNNGNGTFTALSGLFTDVYSGRSAWGDYNNDGLPDLVLAGINSQGANILKIYQNNGNNSFTETPEQMLSGINTGKITFADFDNDGDMDLVINGSYPVNSLCAVFQNLHIMRSLEQKPNTPPVAPTSLNALVDRGVTTLTWDNASDDASPSVTLTYNIKVFRDESIHSLVVNPFASSSGFRTIVNMGNAEYDSLFILKNLAVGKYYWQVQAIDGGYAGGNWSALDSFEIRVVQPYFTFDTVCLGMPTSFLNQSVVTGNTMSCLWTFGDGMTDTAKNPIHVFTEAGIFKVKLFITNDNDITDSTFHDIIVKQKPNAGFEAPNTCLGNSVIVQNTTILNGLTTTSWHWNFGDGTANSEKTVQNPGSYTYVSSDTFEVALIVATANGCADTARNNVIITPVPNANISLSSGSKFSFCKNSGDSAFLSINNQDNCTYKWNNDNHEILGATDHTFLVKEIGGIFTVTVLNKIGNCSVTTSSPVEIEVKESPEVPAITYDNSKISFCNGDSVLLQTVNLTGIAYYWKLNGGIIGANTSLYAKQSGKYSLTVAKGACSVDASNTVTVLVNALPSVFALNNTNVIICDGKNYELKTTAITGVTYQWKKEASDIEGAISNSYTVSKPGLYSLQASLNNCIREVNEPASVSVLDQPAKPQLISATGVTSVCPEAATTLQVSNSDNRFSYRWKYNAGVISNTSPSYSAILDEGDYQVICNNQGCADTSNILSISYKLAPAKPELFTQGPNKWYLATSYINASAYHWYYNGALITEADKNYYVAGTQLGVYYVAVNDGGECWTGSDHISIPENIVVTGIDDEQMGNTIHLWPNPSNGAFNLIYNSTSADDFSLEISTLDGKIVHSAKLAKCPGLFSKSLQLNTKGVYLLKITQGSHISSKKLIVQ